jgi:2-deoxy-D-gluconate 3-dehydrogenase
MSVLQQFDLTGKTALVTGCKRGIGKAMAIALAEAGADIIGVSATLEESGSDIERAITALGRGFEGYACDFSKRDALNEFITKIQSRPEYVDILVNNAGIIKRAPAADHADALWDEVIEVNLSSQFILSREIGRGMIEQGHGKIIFMASLLAFQGGVTVPGYSASKGGIGQLTKALSNEWGSKGINVNAIAPGYIRTDNTQALQDNNERHDAILERIPAGRWGVPTDFSGPIVFLASEASNYLHGTIVTVDGGWMGR